MHDPVYDLGEVDISALTDGGARARRADAIPSRRRKRSKAARGPSPMATAGPAEYRRRGDGRPGFEVPGTLSLAVPGLGQVASGRVDQGLALMALTGFTAAFAWAVWSTLDRLAATLPLLDVSRAWGFRSLLIAYGVVGLLHITAVLTAIDRDRRRAPAAVLAVASAVLPGWGQALAGRRARAGLFLAGMYGCGLLWLLDSPPLVELMARQQLILPEGLGWITGPLVRFTAPAVLWAVAVSDALYGRDPD